MEYRWWLFCWYKKKKFRIHFFLYLLNLDDEDTTDDQEEIKLSSTKKSHLTINEHERFTKAKEVFKTKYNQQIDQVNIDIKK